MTTLAQYRARFYLHEDFGERVVGFASTGTRSATAVTDATRFGSTNIDEWHYADGWIRWASLSGAERVKRAGALSGSTLLHAEPGNWAAPFTGTSYEYTWPNIHPDEFDECIKNALRYVYLTGHLPMTPWADGNFEQADLDDWTSVNSTVQKLADVTYGIVGSRSLVVTNTAANGYAAHNTGLFVNPGETYQLNALARLVSGTGPFYFRIYRYNGGSWGTEITTAPNGEGYTPLHLYRESVTIPADVFRINCRLESAGSGDIVAWDALPGRNLSDKDFALESFARNRFNIFGLAEAVYGPTLSDGLQSQTARSKQFHAWRRGRDFDTTHRAADSAPDALQLYVDARGKELWYEYRRPLFDVAPLASELSDLDSMYDDYVFAAAAVNLCALLNKDGSDGYWENVKAKYQRILSGQTEARRPSKPPERYQRVGGRIGP